MQTDEQTSMARVVDIVVHFLERSGECKTFDIIYRAHEKIADCGRGE